MVSEITPDSGAEGIVYPNDIIIAMDGKTVENGDDLLELLYKYHVGDSVKITVIREDERLELTVVLGE